MAAPRRTSEDEDAFVFVYDRRTSNAPELQIPTGGLFTFADFKARVSSVSALLCLHASCFTQTFLGSKQFQFEFLVCAFLFSQISFSVGYLSACVFHICSFAFRLLKWSLEHGVSWMSCFPDLPLRQKVYSVNKSIYWPQTTGKPTLKLYFILGPT